MAEINHVPLNHCWPRALTRRWLHVKANKHFKWAEMLCKWSKLVKQWSRINSQDHIAANISACQKTEEEETGEHVTFPHFPHFHTSTFIFTLHFLFCQLCVWGLPLLAFTNFTPHTEFELQAAARTKKKSPVRYTGFVCHRDVTLARGVLAAAVLSCLLVSWALVEPLSCFSPPFLHPTAGVNTTRTSSWPSNGRVVAAQLLSVTLLTAATGYLLDLSKTWELRFAKFKKKSKVL